MITAMAGSAQFQYQREAMVQATYESQKNASATASDLVGRTGDGTPSTQPYSFRGMFDGAAPRDVTSFSVQAQIRATFEGTIRVSGPNGKELNAYVSMQAEYNVSAKGSTSPAQGAQGAQGAPGVGGVADFSPEAVANRIVDFAMGFFPMFAADHPEMSDKEQLQAYKELVTGAIDEGFSQAMQVLGNPSGTVGDTIGQTRDLIQEKLNALFDYLSNNGADAKKKAIEMGSFTNLVTDFLNRGGAGDKTGSLVSATQPS